MNDIKYTKEDIDRIFAQRVCAFEWNAAIKKGVIVEWCFEYPNGEKCAFVEASYPVNPDNFDHDVGVCVCYEKIKRKLWELCGQYSIITGEKL